MTKLQEEQGLLEEDEDDEDEYYKVHYTPVPANVFGTPVPLAVSGGTAAFFKVPRVGPLYGPMMEKYGRFDWIGKDAARALDELPFYEEILRSRDPVLRDVLLRWTMPYAGILSTAVYMDTECTEMEDQARDLLLLYNVHAGKKASRFLDIKIGEETAVANWKGKSGFAAWRNRVVDRLTNSAAQGFRLEGFDCPPSSLKTRDTGERAGASAKTAKKIKRLFYQRFPAADFLTFVADTNELQDLYTSPALLSPAEYSEAVVFDAACQMAQLCRDLLRLPAQMWIGSSLCLAYDSGSLPPRQEVLRYFAGSGGKKLAEVLIFDWGRSQLETQESWQELSREYKERNTRYWENYLRGLFRMLFACIRLYICQFCYAEPSKSTTVIIEVFDYDTFDAKDFLCSVHLPLAPTNGPRELELVGADGSTPAGSVQVVITPAPVQSDSRLSESWVIEVIKVSGVPKGDLCDDSDPTLRVTLCAEPTKIKKRAVAYDLEAGQRNYLSAVSGGAKAWTPVVYDDNDAEFNYKMWYGLASPTVQQQFFSRISAALGCNLTFQSFSQGEEGYDYERGFQDFMQTLRSARIFSDLKKRPRRPTDVCC